MRNSPAYQIKCMLFSLILLSNFKNFPPDGLKVSSNRLITEIFIEEMAVLPAAKVAKVTVALGPFVFGKLEVEHVFLSI